MKLYWLDIQNEECLQKTIEKVIGEFGEIDAVLNYAGKDRDNRRIFQWQKILNMRS